MIVVVGSPVSTRLEESSSVAAGGLASGIAIAAARAGSDVELVGKVGEDATGDALLLALAAVRVGHVALLRDAVNGTPSAGRARGPDEPSPMTDEPGGEPEPPPGLPLEPADVELALRYLPDYRVVVVAEQQPTGTARVAADAATWAGAQLVLVVDDEAPAEDTAVPASAWVFQRPAGSDPDGTFARVVGEFAAALDSGATGADAFAELEGRFGVAPATSPH